MKKGTAMNGGGGGGVGKISKCGTSKLLLLLCHREKEKPG